MKKLKIGDGEKFDLTKVSKSEVTQEEAVKNKNRLIKIFNYFNFEGGKTLSPTELALAMDYFSSFDSGDKELSKKELEKAADEINQKMNLAKKEKIKAKDLKSFITNIQNAMANDEKISVDKQISRYNAEIEKQKLVNQAEQNTDVNSSSRSFDVVADEIIDEALNEEIANVKVEIAPKTEREQNALYDYTVQMNENYTDLIRHSLIAQGIESPNKEEIAAAKKRFRQNNPNAVHKMNKTEYLIVGDKVKLEGHLEDKNNAREQKKLWEKQDLQKRQKAEDAAKKLKQQQEAERIAKMQQEEQKKREEEKFKKEYNVDAYYRKKDGSQGRHLNLKATGEKEKNGRFWAVDVNGNKILVAHDGTILDVQKTAKKDKLVVDAKQRYESVNVSIRHFKNALNSLNEQAKKDGWAGKTADAISVLWNSDNREEIVRNELKTYEKQLIQLQKAAAKGEEEFNDKFKEIYGVDYDPKAIADFNKEPNAQNYEKAFGIKFNVEKRVEKYNESQEQGASYVKTGVVVGASIGAAVATGGTSLLVTAAVVGGSTAAARAAVEISDLASNEIDGDVSENAASIAKQSLVEGATAAVLSGAGGTMYKGVNMAVKGTNAGSEFLRASMNVSGDLAMGAGVEYAQTGQVTKEGTIINAAFSMTGQAAQSGALSAAKNKIAGALKKTSSKRPAPTPQEVAPPAQEVAPPTPKPEANQPPVVEASDPPPQQSITREVEPNPTVKHINTKKPKGYKLVDTKTDASGNVIKTRYRKRSITKNGEIKYSYIEQDASGNLLRTIDDKYNFKGNIDNFIMAPDDLGFSSLFKSKLFSRQIKDSNGKVVYELDNRYNDYNKLYQTIVTKNDKIIATNFSFGKKCRVFETDLKTGNSVEYLYAISDNANYLYERNAYNSSDVLVQRVKYCDDGITVKDVDIFDDDGIPSLLW